MIYKYVWICFSDFSRWLNFQMATNQKGELCFRKSEIWHIIDLVTLPQANVFMQIKLSSMFAQSVETSIIEVETCTAVLPQYIE